MASAGRWEAVDVLVATPRRWWSSTYTVTDGADGEGATVASLRFRAVREDGTLDVDGEPLRVRREGLASGAWLLERPGPADGAEPHPPGAGDVLTGDVLTTVLARAEKPSAWRNRLVVDLPADGRRFEVRRRSAWRRVFDVVTGDGRVVGEVRPAGALSRRVVADLPDDLPLPVQVLVLWLALLIMRREENSAAA